MKLIIASPSPFARKVRVALIEKGLACEEVMDEPWSPAAVAPQWNPLGTVPSLVLDDGRALYDSRVIETFLDTLAPPALIPEDPAGRIEALQIESIADAMSDAAVLLVLEEHRRPGMQSAEWQARQRRKLERGAAELGNRLGDRQHFVGDALSIADIAVAATLAYLDLRQPEFAWRAGHPNLVAFSERMEARESFRRTRPYAQPIAAMG
jgi:glutathione S-transferase